MEAVNQKIQKQNKAIQKQNKEVQEQNTKIREQNQKIQEQDTTIQQQREEIKRLQFVIGDGRIAANNLDEVSYAIFLTKPNPNPNPRPSPRPNYTCAPHHTPTYTPSITLAHATLVPAPTLQKPRTDCDILGGD